MSTNTYILGIHEHGRLASSFVVNKKQDEYEASVQKYLDSFSRNNFTYVIVIGNNSPVMKCGRAGTRVSN